MADAMVERRPSPRFFCHRCNIEFEDVLQDYTCPYCVGGFIEQLENDSEELTHSGDDFSDADMSNLDGSDEVHQSTGHMLNDLAFLMSGGRMRGGPGRRETFLEQLVWMIGGGAPLGTGAVTAGAPFVLVGAPGDYVFGGEGLDAVVTQLLGQLENSGSPPLPRDQIDAIPTEAVTPAQAATNTSCSVCWDNFQQGEKISRLECDHIFHSSCIEPWLQLHATCPICRRSLLPEQPDATPVTGASATASATSTSTSTSTTSTATTGPQPQPPRYPDTIFNQMPRVVVQRLPRRPLSRLPAQTWDSAANTSNSSGSVPAASSVTAGGVWPSPRPTNASTTDSPSLNSNNRDHYDMDIDFD